MVTISIHCTHCGKKYNVDDRAAGKNVKCQSCNQTFVASAQPNGARQSAPAANDPLDDGLLDLPPSRAAAARTATVAKNNGLDDGLLDLPPATGKPPAKPQAASPAADDDGLLDLPSLAAPTSKSKPAAAIPKKTSSADDGLLELTPLPNSEKPKAKPAAVAKPNADDGLLELTPHSGAAPQAKNPAGKLQLGKLPSPASSTPVPELVPMASANASLGDLLDEELAISPAQQSSHKPLPKSAKPVNSDSPPKPKKKKKSGGGSPFEFLAGAKQAVAGVGGVVFLLFVVGAKVFNVYMRHENRRSNSSPSYTTTTETPASAGRTTYDQMPSSQSPYAPSQPPVGLPASNTGSPATVPANWPSNMTYVSLSNASVSQQGSNLVVQLDLRTLRVGTGQKYHLLIKSADGATYELKVRNETGLVGTVGGETPISGRPRGPFTLWMADESTGKALSNTVSTSDPRVETIAAAPEQDENPPAVAPPAYKPPVPTPPSNPAEAVTKALADLQSSDEFKKRAAADMLAQIKPIAARRQEVATALEKLLKGSDFFTQQSAATALGEWATADSVPALIEALKGDQFLRRELMNALGKLQDPRAAGPVAALLAEGDRITAKECLVAIGPAAESEVAKLLSHAEWPVRMSACEILTTIGSKQSLPALEPLTRESNGLVKSHANKATAAIKVRGK